MFCRKKIMLSRLISFVLVVSLVSAMVADSVLASAVGGASRAGIPANSTGRNAIPKQTMHQNTFFLQVDPNNTVTRCAGNGYMQSTCYLYPSAWWNPWSYVGPYTPGQSKQVSTLLQLLPLDPNEEGYAEISLVWSTAAWSQLHPGRPPLPGNIPDEETEKKFIERLDLRKVQLQTGSVPQYVTYRHVIQQYSPEWIAVAARGFNFKIISGRIVYERQAPREQMGQMDEAWIREIVLQVIMENPALIQKTLDNYQRKSRIEYQKRQLEASFKNRVMDIQAGTSPTRGPDDAEITIFAFQDFECPYSQRGAATLKPLLKEYSGKIRLVFKNRPQTFHKQAAGAAKAALAAQKQGRFWEYHDLLFENNRSLGEEVFIKLARQLNLDIERFNKDRNSKKIEEQLNTDLAVAKEHNFNGTPTFVINGVVIAGAQPQSYFEDVIKRLLNEK